MFITREDLDNSLYEEIIDAIIRHGQGSEAKAQERVTYGIRTAESVLRSELGSLWDLEPLFARTGEEREPVLVDACANIALYIIADVLEQMPVTVAEPYERTVKWIERVQKGSASIPGAARPADPDTGQTDSYIKHGNIDRIY
jgi:phage gp36-like protein